jgi:hypothetical protein
MNIDYDAYTNMDQKELEKIAIHVKNVLNLREQKIIAAIERRNLEGLKEGLEHNQDKRLSEKAWQAVSFRDMTEKDIGFFLYVREFPKYKEHDIVYSSLTKTQEAVYSSFFDKGLFNFFKNNEEFLPMLKELSQYAINPKVPKEIIKELFENGLITPEKHIFYKALDGKCQNYLEYFFESNIYNVTNEEYKNLYCIGWNSFNDSLIKTVQKKFPDYKDIKLFDLIQNFTFSGQVKNPFYERYKMFTKIDDTVFIRTLENHPFSTDDINNIVVAFNNLTPSQDAKFPKMVELFVEKFPEYLENLKEAGSLIRSDSFKGVYDKAMNYAELHMHLDKKEDVPNKRVKI